MFITNLIFSAGKSTLMQELAVVCPWAEIAYEPEEKFVDFNNVNLLEMSKHGEEEALMSQLAIAQICVNRDIRAIQRALANNKRIVISERSVGSGRYCFTPSLITNVAYTRYYSKFMDNYLKQIAKITYVQECNIFTCTVFLDVDYRVCYKRLLVKYANGYMPATLQYLKQLEQYHKQWMLAGFQMIPSHLGHISHKPIRYVKLLGWGDKMSVISDAVFVIKQLTAMYLHDFQCSVSD